MVSPKKFLPAIFLFLSLVAFFHLFLIDWYRIPSNSMAPTLQNNCIVLTQKSNNSRVLFPKIFQFEIKKNDILIFLKPEWIQNEKDQKIYIKRCYGLPGDTITIKHKRMGQVLNSISTQPSVMFLFPQDTLFKEWTLTNYGPFIIPKKNWLIPLTTYNIHLYQKIIKFENNHIIFKDDKLFIDGKEINNYRFKYNYYFMLGDNFLMSEDSRKWGCLPDKNILGKVLWHS